MLNFLASLALLPDMGPDTEDQVQVLRLQVLLVQVPEIATTRIQIQISHVCLLRNEHRNYTSDFEK